MLYNNQVFTDRQVTLGSIVGSVFLTKMRSHMKFEFLGTIKLKEFSPTHLGMPAVIFNSSCLDSWGLPFYCLDY